mmetsp:Transcript_9796/g.26913  ORF Transcript_9796/g.26913 Transcript_9796/m.26913 type:complete len:203 (+) Transcript_9796:422-1030(+)
MSKASAIASSAPCATLRFNKGFSWSTRRKPGALLFNVSSTAERAASVVEAMYASHCPDWKGHQPPVDPISFDTAIWTHAASFSKRPLLGDVAVGQSSLSSPSSRARMWMATTGTSLPQLTDRAKSSARLAAASLGRRRLRSSSGKPGTASGGVWGFTARTGAKKRLEETVTTRLSASSARRSEHPRSSSASPSFSEFIMWKK